MPDDATLRIVVEAESKPGSAPSPEPPAAPPPGSGRDLRKNDLLDEVFNPKPPSAGPVPRFTGFGASGGGTRPFYEEPPVRTIPTGQRFPGSESTPYTAFGATGLPTAERIPTATPIATPVATAMASPAGAGAGAAGGGMNPLRLAGYAATSFASGGMSTAAGMTSAAMGAAEAGLLGGSAAAAAAGPIGVVAVIAAKIADMIIGEATKLISIARNRLEQIPENAKDILNDRPLALFQRQVNNMAETLEQVPVVGKLFAESLRLAAAPVKVFSETLQAFNERGRQLAAYDSGLANARAQQDVAAMMADIREANQMGDKYAKLVELQTGVDQEFRAAMLPLKELGAKILIDVGVPLLNVVKVISGFIQNQIEGASKVYDLHADFIEAIWDAIPDIGVWAEAKKAFSAIQEAREQERMKGAQTAMTDLLAAADMPAGFWNPVGGIGRDAPDPVNPLQQIMGNLGLPWLAGAK